MLHQAMSSSSAFSVWRLMVIVLVHQFLSTAFSTDGIEPYCPGSAFHSLYLSSDDISRQPSIVSTEGPANFWFLRCFSHIWTPFPGSTAACIAGITSLQVEYRLVAWPQYSVDYFRTIGYNIQQLSNASTTEPFVSPIGGAMGGSAISWYFASAFYGSFHLQIVGAPPPGCRYRLEYTISSNVYTTPTLNITDALPVLAKMDPLVLSVGVPVTFTFGRRAAVEPSIRRDKTEELAVANATCNGPWSDVVHPSPSIDYEEEPLPPLASPPPPWYFRWVLPRGIPKAGRFFICLRSSNTRGVWFDVAAIDVHGGNPAYYVFEESLPLLPGIGRQVLLHRNYTLHFYGLGLSSADGAKAVDAEFGTDCNLNTKLVGLDGPVSILPPNPAVRDANRTGWTFSTNATKYMVCYRVNGSEAGWREVHFYNQLPPRTKEVIGNLTHMTQLAFKFGGQTPTATSQSLCRKLL